MTLRDRLIGGAVDGLMLAIDTIASFWQTPREVEWAKAAAKLPELHWPAKGFAEVLAENPEVAKVLSDLVVDEDHRGYYSTPTCGLVHATFIGGQPGHWHACYRDPGHVGDAHHCLCGYEWENFATIAALVPETSAPTPGAVDGPAVGSPDKPTAVVDWDNPWPRTCADAGAQCKGLCTIDMRDGTIVDPDCFGVRCSVSTPCGCPCVLDQHPDGYHACRHGDAFTPSAEVEPPASAPSAESPAPEFDWVTTAIPVIAGVLAEHRPFSAGRRISGRVCCYAADYAVCGEFADWQDWRAHVAPHVAIALQTDLLSTIYEDTTFAINAFSGDRPRPLADFPKHQK